MREEFPLEPCAGCGAARAVVAVERLRLGGVGHRIEIHLPHAFCRPGEDCGYVVVIEDRVRIGPASPRTRPSRRRS